MWLFDRLYTLEPSVSLAPIVPVLPFAGPVDEPIGTGLTNSIAPNSPLDPCELVGPGTLNSPVTMVLTGNPFASDGRIAFLLLFQVSSGDFTNTKIDSSPLSDLDIATPTTSSCPNTESVSMAFPAFTPSET